MHVCVYVCTGAHARVTCVHSVQGVQRRISGVLELGLQMGMRYPVLAGN